jgi:protein TonB
MVNLIYSPFNSLNMRPENILQASVLDIIFENRNKGYGAYELRRHYNQRLSISMAIVFSIVGILIAISAISKLFSHHSAVVNPFSNRGTTTVVELLRDPQKPKEPEKVKSPEKKKSLNQSKLKEVQYTNRFKYEQNTLMPPPTQLQLMNHLISNKTDSSGINTVGNRPFIPKPLEPVTGEGTISVVDANPVSNSRVSEPASFPGGNEALIRFLQRNLKVPSELEAGESKRVVASFVVKADGSIEALDIKNSAGKSFDQEVIRVIGLMPKWKPARLGDRSVAVYFSLPVVFTVSEE